MIVAMIGEGGIAYDGCRELLTRLGHVVVDEIAGSDVAVAPLLQTKISAQAAATPRHGTLIFHPSPLPYGRGRNAIKAAYKRASRYRPPHGFGRPTGWTRAIFASRR